MLEDSVNFLSGPPGVMSGGGRGEATCEGMGMTDPTGIARQSVAPLKTMNFTRTHAARL